jgi:hypothetical protein
MFTGTAINTFSMFQFKDALQHWKKGDLQLASRDFQRVHEVMSAVAGEAAPISIALAFKFG